MKREGEICMNILKKLWCRTFQLGFRIAQPILPYREPKILNAIEEIPEALLKENINSVLLITDGFLRKSGATAPLEKILMDSGIHLAVYDKTQPNPTVYNVEEAKSLFIKENCKQCLLCVPVCPDSSIPVVKGERGEFDYDHCKGCGICAKVCPFGAITMREGK